MLVKILMIDDEKKLCDVVKEGLEKSGNYRVDIAANGNDGIKMAKRLKPDLILLDVRMPGIGGIEVLKILKGDKDTLAIPVVMLSAVVNDLTKIECSCEYSESYIEKPADIATLTAKIEEVLNLHRSMKK